MQHLQHLALITQRVTLLLAICIEVLTIFYSPVDFLGRADSLLGISNRTILIGSIALMLGSFAIEFLSGKVAFFLFNGFIGTAFALATFTKAYFGLSRECPCLGFLGTVLHLEPVTITAIKYIVIGLLVVPALAVAYTEIGSRLFQRASYELSRIDRFPNVQN